MWAFAILAIMLVFAFLTGLIHLFMLDKATLTRCAALIIARVLANYIFGWGINSPEWFLAIPISIVGVWKWYE
jgi:hypothetical protein